MRVSNAEKEIEMVKQLDYFQEIVNDKLDNTMD